VQADEVKAERMTHVLGLLDKPASTWMNNIYSEAAGHSWEMIMPAFIAMVREGRDTRAALTQQMKTLKFGWGKCRDLLSFNEQFETLRMKLYPSSSIDRNMSIRCGEDYGAAIERGDPDLYVEVLRGLNFRADQTHEPDLSAWRTATANAVRIREVQRDVLRNHPQRAIGGGQRGFQQQQQLRPALRPAAMARVAAAQHADLHAIGTLGGDETEERKEGEEDAATVQQQLHYAGAARRGGGGGAAAGSAAHRPQSYRLSDDERRQLMTAGRCFQCYAKGHLAKDPACPERGQPRRAPLSQQLKA
jgi:hypothetical protein